MHWQRGETACVRAREWSKNHVGYANTRTYPHCVYEVKCHVQTCDSWSEKRSLKAVIYRPDLKPQECRRPWGCHQQQHISLFLSFHLRFRSRFHSRGEAWKFCIHLFYDVSEHCTSLFFAAVQTICTKWIAVTIYWKLQPPSWPSRIQSQRSGKIFDGDVSMLFLTDDQPFLYRVRTTFFDMNYVYELHSCGEPAAFSLRRWRSVWSLPHIPFYPTKYCMLPPSDAWISNEFLRCFISIQIPSILLGLGFS
jgi:hypothetical protein